MERRRKLTFGKGHGTLFRLEVRGGSDGRRTLTFFRGGQEVHGLSKQTLELLGYLLERSGKDCPRDQILDAISPDSDNNLVDRYVSTLRETLSPDKADLQKYIETVEGGYRFRLEVEAEGDLGSMDGFAEWNKLRFQELMGELKPGSDKESEDIRIVATGISPSLDVLDIKGLLRRQLRIRILMMDPAKKELIQARYGLRRDWPQERLVRDLQEQIADIESHAKIFRRDENNPRRGWLEYSLSDAMPCGFVIHTKRWALLGIFLAHTTYSDGPMFEIRSETAAWEQLYQDWKVRWEAATTVRQVKVSRDRSVVPALPSTQI